jgi:hypothetical protein
MISKLQRVLLAVCLSLALGTGIAYSSEEPEASVDQKPKVEDTNTDETDKENDGPSEQSQVEDTEKVELPEIKTDLSELPFPTRRMRELILEASKTGNIEKLRALIGTGDTATMLSLGGFDGDAIDYLKTQSGDEDGHELLAILEEVLQSGYVQLDEGTENEIFVWPYFFAYPLDKLSDRQRVELFRIVTFGDYQDMVDFGGYIFYRVGISPTGRWQFFVAGD